MAKTKYYNPATLGYVEKKGQLPPEYREIVRQLNASGILEKMLINQVLRGEKSVEQLIAERKVVGKVSKNILEEEEKTKLFEEGNPWLTILKSFGCEISEAQSADQITDILQSVFGVYCQKRQYLPLLRELYEKQHGTDKELFEKLTSFASLSNLNSYKHLHVALTELKKKFLNVFGSESEILRVANKVALIRFYDTLGINFEKLNYTGGFTEEEKKELESLLDPVLKDGAKAVEDVPALVTRINSKLQTYINNLKKRFVEWHDELYAKSGYADRFKEFEQLKEELKKSLKSHPTCTLEDGVYLAYSKILDYQSIKPDHLSVKKVEITANRKIRCKVCQVEKSLSDPLPETEASSESGFRLRQTLTEPFSSFASSGLEGRLQTVIDEIKKLKSEIETTEKRTSVQIADIELTVDSLHKIFNSIRRVHDKYGLKYFADVLKGSQNKKVLERKGKKLPAFGLLAENKTQDIENMLTELVMRDFLRINERYDSGIYYPLVGLAHKAHTFLESIEQTKDTGKVDNPDENGVDVSSTVVFDKNTIVRTFNQFDNNAKSVILEKLAKDQEIKILKEFLTYTEGKERESLVENALKYLEKPRLEPFLLNIFNLGNGKEDGNIEKLRMLSCDYFLQHLNKKLLPIFKFKVTKEKYPAVKEKLQEIVTVLEK
jgi:hypothetical protein